MNSSDQQNLKEKVIHEIKDGNAIMRPKYMFTLKAIALLVTAFFTLLVSILIFNFIFFSLRIGHHMEFLHQGPPGFILFLRFFPWPLLLIDIGLIVLLQFLLRQFKMGYRLPTLYLIAIILCSTVVVGAIIDRGTRFNDHMMRRMEGRHLPPPFQKFEQRVRLERGFMR